MKNLIHAWQDLYECLAAGDTRIDQDNINKHRADMFRFASRLPVDVRVRVPPAELQAILTVYGLNKFDADATRQPNTARVAPDVWRQLAD